MSFDEEGDHYMSKADFALMCDELKKAVSQRDALLAALKEIILCAENLGFCEGGQDGIAELYKSVEKAHFAIAKADLTQ